MTKQEKLSQFYKSDIHHIIIYTKRYVLNKQAFVVCIRLLKQSKIFI